MNNSAVPAIRLIVFEMIGLGGDLDLITLLSGVSGWVLNSPAETWGFRVDAQRVDLILCS